MPCWLSGVADLINDLLRKGMLVNASVGYVKLFDFDGECSSGSLCFLDGNVIFCLGPVHIDDVWLAEHITYNHVLALPLTFRTRARHTVHIILDHAISFSLEHCHIRWDIVLHDQWTRFRSKQFDGLIGIHYLSAIHTQQHMPEADASSICRSTINGEATHGPLSQYIHKLLRSRCEESITNFNSRGEDGTEHLGGYTCFVVFTS
mmetsp:Transcript_5793/g.12865  ORF Transcript_5793/g.12865 Transcript_5793/m.12865 type:complete len:205 (+) Transcript_5793:383-997(+)